MSVDRRRTDLVRQTVRELFANGKDRIRVGDVCSVLRAQNSPIGTWQVRAELTSLAEEGTIVLDEDTADWLPGNLGQ